MHTDTTKHAYLIIAHNNWKQLKMLLQLLDDERNDIYIHVDKKSKISNSELIELGKIVSKARIEWTKRIAVNWGGYSQVKAEIILLEAAVKDYHLYYHLLSGADLPIKSQDEIHSFFSSHYPSEFVRFQRNVSSEYWINQRIREYHFLQDCIGRKTGKIISVLSRLEDWSIRIQRKMAINRVPNGIEIYKGDQWFSITHELAVYVLSKKREMKILLNYGVAVDELFVQTIVKNSEFCSHIDCDIKREIDWNRGSPYVWKMEDLGIISNSTAFWARKFDETVDARIVETIFKNLVLKESE